MTQDAQSAGYRQIIKASALLGGAQVITMGLGLIRTKAISLLLGPEGIGLFGLFTTISDFAGTITGLGVGSGGVRNIAEAADSERPETLAETAQALKILTLLTGAAGALILALASPWISRLTFGDGRQTVSLLIVAPAVLFGNLATAFTAILRGRRLLRDMAAYNISSAALSVPLSVACYWALGKEGIPWAITVSAAAAALLGHVISRKNPIPPTEINRERFGEISRSMVKIGVGFVVSGLTFSLVNYAIRTYLVKQSGEAALGYYTASYGLSYLLANLVMGSMAADFYPRLVSAVKCPKALSTEVNTQIQAGLLLGLPGLLCMLAGAKWLIPLFYAKSFAPAVPVLGAFILGIVIKLIHNPLCYILMAKGDAGWFAASEVFYGLTNVALCCALAHDYGALGAAIGFAINNLLHVGVLTLLGRWRAGLRIHNETLALGAGAPTVCLALLLIPRNSLYADLLVTGIAACGCVASLALLKRRMGGLGPLERIFAPAMNALKKLNLRKE